MNKIKLIPVALLAIATLLVAGCAHKYSAERDGKKLGEAICDLSEATTKEEAQSAVDDIQKQADDIGSKYSVWTAQDRSAIQGNLADLAEHSVQGNDVLIQQDLAVIQRNADQLKKQANDTGSAVLDGIQQGLSDCTE